MYVYQPKKSNYIDNGKIIRTLTDNLCCVTKQQIAEIVKMLIEHKQLKIEYREDILRSSIKRECRANSYRTEDILNGKDTIITPYGASTKINVLPCFWVLLDMMKGGYIDINNVFKGKHPETLSFSSENITYAFYYVTNETLGFLPKTIERANLYKSLGEKTRDTKYHLINVYVTDDLEVAHTISNMGLDIPYQIAVTKWEESPFEKPVDIAYIVDGERIEKPIL